MVYSIQDVMRDVRVCLDQNMMSDALAAEDDMDTLSLDDIVRSKIAEAARRVETEAPVYYLEEGHNFGDAMFWDGRGSGHVLLPDDFMRLIAFRMSDWERTVYAAISPENPEYARQSSRYKGIRGNVQKPVCAIVNRPEGKVLEFYSCNSHEAYVECGTYLPYPEIDKWDGIDISERCYKPVVYMAAALVLTTCGEADKASAMTELAKSMIE